MKFNRRYIFSCQGWQIVHIILGLCSKHPENIYSFSKSHYLERCLLNSFASLAKVGERKTLRSQCTSAPARSNLLHICLNPIEQFYSRHLFSKEDLNLIVRKLKNIKTVRTDKRMQRLPRNIYRIPVNGGFSKLN